MRRLLGVLTAAAAIAGAGAQGAHAAFPYLPPGADQHDYSQYRQPPGATPNDLTGDTIWKFAATPEPGNSTVNSEAQELYGVRGAHVVDADPNVATAWEKTTGRPDVAISVLDSGIEWNDPGAMADLREKVRLNRGELPVPNTASSKPLIAGVSCSTYKPGANPKDAYDLNDDGVFNLRDYACDSRAEKALSDPRRAGPSGMLTPQDLIIAFSDGTDADHNGYVDDIAGWDFLDNDNDPYDDVHYGHGTGEALDSNAEADNGGDLGSCPNCTVIPLRVGDSFIADSNRFAAAVTYGVDNDSLVIQEALGAVDNTSFARAAVNYAYRHGVVVIASAADEAAQHHNYPSNLPHTIVVNSVRKYDSTFTPVPKSYLQFNGCTNFGSKITVSIPSVSCSSEATGRGAGMAGLIYSAALDARQAGKLAPSTTCKLADGKPCPITANEVRQLMASGEIDGAGQADDVDFAGAKEPSCAPTPTPGCTDPNGALTLLVEANRPVISPVPGSPTPSRSYPARKGYDQFYGYGRIDAARAVDALLPASGDSLVPPEVEITSPDWYTPVDPTRGTQAIGAQIDARGAPYTCTVEVAPGGYPNNAAYPNGDFRPVTSSFCDGKGTHTGAFNGTVAQLDLAKLRASFPSGAGDFRGPNPPASQQLANGRPNSEPFGFTVRIVATTTHGATSTHGATTLRGQDRRAFFLHRDRSALAGFPRHLPSDGESSPLLVDVDGDNRNELVYATADGLVHAVRANGRELPGWPVRGDQIGFLHAGSRAFSSGQVSSRVSGAIIGGISAGDLRHDGETDIVAADFEGHVYAWDPHGRRIFSAQSNPAYSGKPLRPFANVRKPTTGRTQHGFITAPVVADLDGDGTPEIVAAALDRHLYAWHASGRAVPGFPVEVVDPSKVASIDPTTHSVTFKPDVGADFLQGALVDTPAVGDIDHDGRPEIVVGSNEEYAVGKDGGLNVGNVNTTSLGVVGASGLLTNANDRVYAIHSTGNRAQGGPFLAHWPFKVASLDAELLPVVGEGITGSPIIGPVSCPSGGSGAKVGVMPAAGVDYILNPDATSCYGNDPSNGKPIGLATDVAASAQRRDAPDFAAVGDPAFGAFPGGTAFVGPVAGLTRALDLVANEYQGGQDFIGAWTGSTGQFSPGFPAAVDDLQFLTGPAVADIDGRPGQEVLGGSASLDLDAFSSTTGQPVPGWPKLTTDWTIATPTVGSLGTLDTSPTAHKAVIGLTRSGELMAFGTAAPACSTSSWPRFHHDDASSGDYARDAKRPGRPYELRVRNGRLSFRSPGDDLLCGTARRYEVVQSSAAITPASFAGARRVGGAPQPAKAGTSQSLALPRGVARYVAIRAVDEQGNLGPPAVVALTPSQRQQAGGGSGGNRHRRGGSGAGGGRASSGSHGGASFPHGGVETGLGGSAPSPRRAASGAGQPRG